MIIKAEMKLSKFKDIQPGDTLTITGATVELGLGVVEHIDVQVYILDDEDPLEKALRKRLDYHYGWVSDLIIKDIIKDIKGH